MRPRGIVTTVLLVFVAASLVWLGEKEVARSRALKALRGQPVSTAQASSAEGAPAPVAAPSLRAAQPAIEFAGKSPEPMPARAPAPAPKTPATEPAVRPAHGKDSGVAIPSKVVVYYLHTTARCPGCLKIESYTAAEVTGPLAGLLASGRLEWKVLNVDEPQNAHLVDHYKLFTKSVVISEVVDGKEVRWKRLDKVWDFLGDQQAFMRYVGGEIQAYLKEAS